MNNHPLYHCAILACFFSCFSLAQATQVTTVFMAGDSTMAVKQAKDYPETGWGSPFAHFFDDTIAVKNLAKNGASTRTFSELGLWQQIVDTLKPGDFVLIQFGHNDEVEKKVDRYTTPKQYRENLLRFIEQTRKLKATPILLSPITRRYFDPQGNIQHTHPYAKLSREVAEQSGVTFIDMDTISRHYFQALGDKSSAMRFLHLKPNVHPNYPNGIKDNTHFNELGAREVAQLVLAELKKHRSPLAGHLRKAEAKHLSFSYD